MMKYYMILFFCPLFLEAQTLTLNEVIRKADPENRFYDSQLKIRIQEPRVQNPARYSEVFLDFQTGAFQLSRNREDKVAFYTINAGGLVEVALDGSKIISDRDRKKYLMDPERTIRYRQYYQYLYGLPMILNDEKMFRLIGAKPIQLDGKDATEFHFRLKEPIFTPEWILTIDNQSLQIQKLLFYHPDKPDEGEFLLMDGNYEFNGISIPRMKHWYIVSSQEYLGSDIIMHTLNTVIDEN